MTPVVRDDKMPQMSRQLELPFRPAGEAHKGKWSEEALSAEMDPTDPGMSLRMEDVLERDNLMSALKRVRSNKGSPGVDGVNVRELGPYLRANILGWRNYFMLTTSHIALRSLEGWIRRRLRAIKLSQWKNCSTIARRLRTLGASEKLVARVTAFHGCWWYAAGGPSNSVLTNRLFDEMGLPRLAT